MAYDGDVNKVEEKLSDADILDRAADLIEQFGWTVYRLECSKGSLCIAGAILKAKTGFPEWGYNTGFKGNVKTAYRLANYMGFDGIDDEGEMKMIHWNNSLDAQTGKQQVISRLRKAASDLRSS